METQTRKLLISHWSGNEEADHTLACITQLFACDILIISAFIFLQYEEVNIGQLVVVFSICNTLKLKICQNVENKEKSRWTSIKESR